MGIIKGTGKALLWTTKATAKATWWATKEVGGAVGKEIAEFNEKKRIEADYQRKISLERELAEIRNKAALDAYRNQMEILLEFKKQGADIDREVFAMREKLLLLERQENDAMVQDLLDTLDRL